MGCKKMLLLPERKIINLRNLFQLHISITLAYFCVARRFGDESRFGVVKEFEF